MFQSKEIRPLDRRFIEVIEDLPGIKEEKQKLLLEIGLKVSKTNYKSMWKSLIRLKGRDEAAQIVFKLVHESGLPLLQDYLHKYKNNQKFKLKLKDPKIIYDFFWTNGSLRRIGELYLGYLNERGEYVRTDKEEIHFDVALSFAGEDRIIVEDIAKLLRKWNVSLFYDKFNEIDIWGADLSKYLGDIYSNKAKYCVIFISTHYIRKGWPTFEKQHALSRQIKEKEGYILPIKLDEVDLPGLPGIIGYIDGRNKSSKDLALLIKQKVQQNNSSRVSLEENRFNSLFNDISERLSEIREVLCFPNIYVKDPMNNIEELHHKGIMIQNIYKEIKDIIKYNQRRRIGNITDSDELIYTDKAEKILLLLNTSYSTEFLSQITAVIKRP